jgi:threonine/homoserine/homoserine lactone efflux protein
MSRSIAAAVPGPLLVVTIQRGSVGPLLFMALAVMGSPGPATISLTAAASACGVRRALGYLTGLIVGTAIVLVAWLIAGACLASMPRDPTRARIINTVLAAARLGATALGALR